MGRTAAATVTTAAKPSTATNRTEYRNQEGHRETVEAIVVAFILALGVRGFEAQAFVIPTGSMAPTLMGRHKEVTCPQCGFVYAVNASEEIEGSPYPRRVYAGTCVNCRFQATRLDDEPSFKGDRILVSMFPYDLPYLPGASEPERWDVVVFRYPEEPEVSYIKRLVGLPGETIRIYHGDLFVKAPDSSDFRLQRKPLMHQRAMQIPVFDDRLRPRATAGRDEWTRWKSEQAGGWKVVDPSVSSYRCEQPTNDWVELRYRHLAPDPEQWQALLSDRTPAQQARPTLITDFYSYNTNLTADGADLVRQLRGDSENAWLQPHWVGDLTVSARVDVTKAAGELKLELIKAGVAHRCLVDLATGKATLSRGDEALGEFETSISRPGRYELEFANVDDRLTLLVDGRQVGGEGVEFDRGDDPIAPTEADLSPAAVAVRNATVVVSDLVLKRDIYYTQTPGRHDYGPVWEDRYPRTPVELFDFLADPSGFPALANVRHEEYELGEDRFMMMGDNSPRSKDSRGWDSADREWDPNDRESWEVPRRMVTGKAFFVYWPHGVPFGPDVRVSRDSRIPFRPYFERMRWIR